jgi:hypothetical protein
MAFNRAKKGYFSETAGSRRIKKENIERPKALDVFRRGENSLRCIVTAV